MSRSTKSDLPTGNDSPTTQEPIVPGRIVTITIRGISELMWSRRTPSAPDKVDKNAWEEKVWRQKYWELDGHLAIIGLGLRNSLAIGAKDIPVGQKGKMFGNIFMTALVPTAATFATDVPVADIKPTWQDMNGNPGGAGKRGQTRVPKLIPTVGPGWTCTAEFIVLDDRISADVMQKAVVRGGLFCGVGALRAQGGGVRGRYEFVGQEWQDTQD